MKLVYRIKIDVDNPQPRAEIQHAGGRGDSTELTPDLINADHSRRQPDAPLRRSDGRRSSQLSKLRAAKSSAWSGPDGAGKTTTLRLLCGLLDPTEGEAWVAGHNVARELDAVKDQIGYMAQRFGLYGDLTVDENMNFYADLFGISKAASAIT